MVGAATITAADQNVFASGLEATKTYRSRGGRSVYQQPTETSSVALIKGNDRADNIYKALKLIEDQVLSGIKGKQILIKPNFVQELQQSTGCNLTWMRSRVFWNSFARTTRKRYGLAKQRPRRKAQWSGTRTTDTTDLVQRVQSQARRPQPGRILGGISATPSARKMYQFPIRICAPFLDPNLYIISTAITKTHGFASVTLSLKNMLLGAPINDYKVSDKPHMHMGPHGEPNDIIHFNMFHMAQHVFPDLAVIDGFTGMEGDGPSRGTPVDSRIALASVDPLAADVLGARVMGLNAKKILYLSAMTEAGMGQGNLEKINVLGNRIEDCSYRFKVSPLLHFSAALDS